MQIKKKIDAELILENFTSIARWDEKGDKYYFVFPDNKRNGQWTLMKYVENHFSVHGLGIDYSDEEELFFDEHDRVVSFLWENRSAFNSVLKSQFK